MVYVYILKLIHNKYYIGKTVNPKLRLDEHFTTCGSSWTKKYKPLKIIKIIPDCDNFDEDKYTIKYMKEYGINKVIYNDIYDYILKLIYYHLIYHKYHRIVILM